MKKQNSLYRMTTSEMQIMTYLWNSKEPAIASQIVSDLIPTQNCTWKPRSVFTILKSLSEKAGVFGVLSGKGRLSDTGKSNSQVSAIFSAGTFLYRQNLTAEGSVFNESQI